MHLQNSRLLTETYSITLMTAFLLLCILHIIRQHINDNTLLTELQVELEKFSVE